MIPGPEEEEDPAEGEDMEWCIGAPDVDGAPIMAEAGEGT